jgi:site-specific recombinase XerC
MKPARAKWVRIAENIYRKGDRLRVVASVGTAPHRLTDEAYYQIDDARPLKQQIKEAQVWQHDRRGELRQEVPTAAKRGTLRAAAADLLAELPVPTSKQDRTKENLEDQLTAWLIAPIVVADRRRGVWGDMPASRMTAHDVKVLRARWQSDGVANGTINHRVRALRKLYESLDTTQGRTGYDPTRHLARLPPAPEEDRSIPLPLRRRIIAGMPDQGRPPRGARWKDGTFPTVSGAKLRLAVICETGLPYAQLMKHTALTVDLKGTNPKHPPGPHMYNAPREKGEGVRAGWIPLTPEAVTTWRAFAAGNLWGYFSRSAVRKAFLKAVARERKACKTDAARHAFDELMPPNPKPYDLRHSFATDVFEATGREQGTGLLLQHSDERMMKRYTVGARAKVMGDTLRLYLEATTPPAPPTVTTPKPARPALRAVRGGKR